MYQHRIETLLIGLDDKDARTCKLSSSEISRLGSLVVYVYRAERTTDSTPNVDESGRATSEILDELPEAVMKGLEIKINTKSARKMGRVTELTGI